MKKKHKTGLVLRAQRSAAPPRGKAFLSALLPAALLSLGLAQTAASVFPSGVSNGWAAAAILFAFSPVLLALAQTKAAPWMLAAGVLVLGAAAAIFFAPLRDGFCALGNDILSVLPEKTGRIHMLWDVENTANARAAALFLAAATELLLCTGASHRARALAAARQRRGEVFSLTRLRGPLRGSRRGGGIRARRRACRGADRRCACMARAALR